MNKLLIVTGATSGIGLATIKKFLAIDNLYILAIGRKLTNLDIDSDKLIKKSCDVVDFAEVNQIITDIKDKFQIVGLINAAGVAERGDFTDEKHDIHNTMIDVNIKGLTNFSEVILPEMRKHNFGTIINLSSLADRYPRPQNSVYAATKAYVKSLSDSLRMQNAKYNIRVINVAPALVATPMVINALGITDGTIEVEKFANIMKFIYEQPQDICIRDIVVAPTSYEG